MNDAHEREIEQSIADALAAIGNAAPPGGMEQRVRFALQHHASPSAPRSPFPGWRWIAPVAGVALMVLAVASLRHNQTAPVPLAGNTQTPRHAPPVQAAGQDAVATQRLAHSQRSAVPGLPALVSSAQGTVTVASTGIERDRPAPPLPLTTEEKLLLRFVHRGEPMQLAALDDARSRGVDFAAQKEQFDDFFYLNVQEVPNEAN